MPRSIALLAALVLILGAYGCTTVQQGAGMGAAAGATAGLLYAELGDSGTSNFEGAAAGAVVGGLVGALLADVMAQDTGADMEYQPPTYEYEYEYGDTDYDRGMPMK